MQCPQTLRLMTGSTVLVVGGGGREHALCLALDASPLVDDIHCLPGNAGTALVATNHASSGDIASVMEVVRRVRPSLVVVGPEAPLCEGLADACMDAGVPCFGPVAALAHLEGSKLHAKETMAAAGVPTAEYQRLDASSDVDAALDQYAHAPWVVKRDVLAGGKGVVVTSDRNEARAFIESSITTDGFVLLEAFLPGEEASMLVVMDGHTYRTLPPSQDHKRAFDGDQGPNTGGMGAYCPAPVVSESVHRAIEERIVEPMHRHLSSQTIPYRGVLFIGLMIDEHGDPYVVEFNVRFGDPECQVTLPLLDTDVFAMLHGAATDTLDQVKVGQLPQSAVTVVLAASGYPNSPKKGDPINGLPEALADATYRSSWVNLAGVTANEGGVFLSSGGRVLSCTAMASSLGEAVEVAYACMGTLSLEGSHFRRDIGHRALP